MITEEQHILKCQRGHGWNLAPGHSSAVKTPRSSARADVPTPLAQHGQSRAGGGEAFHLFRVGVAILLGRASSTRVDVPHPLARRGLRWLKGDVAGAFPASS